MSGASGLNSSAYRPAVTNSSLVDIPLTPPPTAQENSKGPKKRKDPIMHPLFYPCLILCVLLLMSLPVTAVLMAQAVLAHRTLLPYILSLALVIFFSAAVMGLVFFVCMSRRKERRRRYAEEVHSEAVPTDVTQDRLQTRMTSGAQTPRTIERGSGANRQITRIPQKSSNTEQNGPGMMSAPVRAPPTTSIATQEERAELDRVRGSVGRAIREARARQHAANTAQIRTPQAASQEGRTGLEIVRGSVSTATTEARSQQHTVPTAKPVQSPSSSKYSIDLNKPLPPEPLHPRASADTLGRNRLLEQQAQERTNPQGLRGI